MFTKVNGKDVIGGPILHNINGFVLQFYLEGVWLWRISGGYSQEMVGVGLGESNIYHQSVWNTMCGGIYDIVVSIWLGGIFGGVCFRECYCLTPSELYLTKKMSPLPEDVLPSNPPEVLPVT